MLKLLIIICLALILSFHYSQTKTTSDKIRIKEEGSGKYTTQYFYNPDGRVSAIKTFGYDTMFYRYHDSIVINSIKVTDYGKQHLRTDSMIIGKNCWVVQNYIRDGPNSDFACYSYTDKGFLCPSRVNHGVIYSDSTSYIYNKDGSLKTESNFTKRRLLVIDYYYYYTDKPNTIGNENKGQSYMGNDGKHPLKELLRIRPGNKDTTRFIYKYDFDNENRIIRQYNYGLPTYYEYVPPVPDTIQLLGSTSFTYY
jgi:hypothetical protein